MVKGMETMRLVLLGFIAGNNDTRMHFYFLTVGLWLVSIYIYIYIKENVFNYSLIHASVLAFMS